jgi:hypothetical protein
MRLIEEKKIVPIFNSADINAGADGDSINMKGFHHVALVCMFGPSLSGDAVLKVYCGATDGAKTNALTFSYRYGGAATGSASSDDFSAEATSAALTVTGTTFVSRCLVIELDASQITADCPWLTLEVSAAADAGQLTVVAVLEPRYASPADTTALT